MLGLRDGKPRGSPHRTAASRRRLLPTGTGGFVERARTATLSPRGRRLVTTVTRTTRPTTDESRTFDNPDSMAGTTSRGATVSATSPANLVAQASRQYAGGRRVTGHRRPAPTTAQRTGWRVTRRQGVPPRPGPEVSQDARWFTGPRATSSRSSHSESGSGRRTCRFVESVTPSLTWRPSSSNASRIRVGAVPRRPVSVRRT